jgi:hypothetical protein
LSEAKGAGKLIEIHHETGLLVVDDNKVNRLLWKRPGSGKVTR